MFNLEQKEEYVYNFIDNNDSDTGIYFTEEDVQKIGSQELFFATILQNGSLMRAYNKHIYHERATSDTLSALARYLRPTDRDGRMKHSLEDIMARMRRPLDAMDTVYFRCIPPPTNNPFEEFTAPERYSLVRSVRFALKMDPALVSRSMYNGVTSAGAGAGWTGGKWHRKHTRKRRPGAPLGPPAILKRAGEKKYFS